MSSQTEMVRGSAALDQLNKKMSDLKERAFALVVKDASGIIAAKNLEVELKSYLKALDFQTGPDIEIAKEHLRTLKEQDSVFRDPAETLLKQVIQTRKDWENEERRLTELERQRKQKEADDRQREKADADLRESKRIAAENKEHRVKEIRAMLKSGEIGMRESARLLKQAGADEEAAKANAAAQAEETAKAAPVVTVKADIPAVAGTVSRVNWKFRIVDETKIPRIWCAPNEQAIGKFVRDAKNKAAAEITIPGIEVWSE